jgi:peroxiredoxin Q/BCP
MTNHIATLGQSIADFSIATTKSQNTHLSDFKGKMLLLYFYPKDNTPGCTIEANDFKNAYPDFLAAHTCILGISRDDLKSHARFQQTCNLPFPLISDEKEELCRYFDVLKEKNMYGKKIFGIERSTFLIDTKGVLIQEWRNVKVPQHAQIVLAIVKQIDSKQTTALT